MRRGWRITLFLGGALAVGVMFGLSLLDIPSFGTHHHPYRDHAIDAATRHQTANAVMSVTFDQRALDTLGEEAILVGSVVGVAALLRPGRGEHERDEEEGRGFVIDSTKFVGYVTLAVTLVVGLDLVAHGHVTPGGGFQGGVVVGTALHLLYVSGTYASLKRFRPVEPYELAEAVGAGGFAVLGVAGVFTAGSFLANIVPQGRFGQLFSAGTVPILDVAVGIAVAGATMVLLAQFLEQALEVEGDDEGGQPESGGGSR